MQLATELKKGATISGDRSFTVAGPHSWNILPANL